MSPARALTFARSVIVDAFPEASHFAAGTAGDALRAVADHVTTRRRDTRFVAGHAAGFYGGVADTGVAALVRARFTIALAVIAGPACRAVRIGAALAGGNTRIVAALRAFVAGAGIVLTRLTGGALLVATAGIHGNARAEAVAFIVAAGDHFRPAGPGVARAAARARYAAHPAVD